MLGHRAEPARRVAVTPAALGGHAIYGTCEASESRGTLCTRCGQYTEHPWVATARAVTGREP